MFANGPADLGSIPGRVIPKTKNVLDTSLLNTQQYKVCIKDKVEQFRERSSTLPYTYLGVVGIEKGALWSPSTTVTSFTTTFIFIYIYIYIYIYRKQVELWSRSKMQYE